jgi:predicted NBD/HSP70 family sugar kinase
VESFISGPALEKFYAQQSGKTLKLPEIVEAYYQHGDPHARATLQRLCHYFGRALATVINILDPDAVVLGGGVGNIELLYTEGVAELKKYVFNYRLETKILKPALGDSAGVFGAAMLV